MSSLEQARSLRDEAEFKFPDIFTQLPNDTKQKLHLIDRDISRLRDPDLKVAFVGGFSAGKSSLVNAFLGRYLLPESVEPTTAVPTYVRVTRDATENAEIHYLAKAECDELEELLRVGFARETGQQELWRAPASEILQYIENNESNCRGIKC